MKETRMNAKTTRILKETRPLFWPWCAVILTGTLPLAHAPDWTVDLIVVGFLLGFLLLGTLPFGNEFQHRTLSLLLAQPIGRMEIWSEKLSVMVAAVLSAALVLLLAWRVSAVHLNPYDAAFFGAWIIATVTSATFWTLLARSTLGGLALNISVNCLVIEMPWLVLYHEKLVSVPLPPSTLTVSAITFILLCYAGVMLWLGRRTLARFQVTEGMAGDDLLMAGPSVMPRALAGWFRCQPTGAVLNLFRKELRLLRPVWLISVLAALGWACLTLPGLRYERGYSSNFETAVIIMGVGSTLMIAILAGSVSLGEERTSGTHAWHMTLPVAARRQWLVKLCMALFAGLVGAWLLPMLITGRFFGKYHMLADVNLGVGWPLVVVLVSFASFWCACAVKGTVRAVLWVFPVLIAIGLANVFGERWGRELVDLLVAKFDLFASFRFATAVSRLGPKLLFRLIDAASENMTGSIQTARVLTAILLVPVLLLAMIQSYRLFRAQLQERALSVVRSLLPLVMTAFLCSFSLLAYYAFVRIATGQTQALVTRTALAIEEILRARAIEKTQPGLAKLDATHPLQLTGDDVEKADPERAFKLPFPMSDSTRRWLRNARITVTPDKAHPSGFYCWEPERASTWCYYSATIHLADRADLIESWEPNAQRKFSGHLTVQVHWPGAVEKETLWDR
jgi:ABC-type transport system involved in multi-copper enzyme maturation permease subunit